MHKKTKGLATPLCSCGALPMALSLSAAGSAPAAVVSFLTAAQSAGLDSVVFTNGMMGWQVALYRLFGSLLIAVASGVAVGNISTHTKDDVKHMKSNKVRLLC